MRRVVHAGFAAGVVVAALGVVPALAQPADSCPPSAGETAKIAGAISAPEADEKVYDQGNGVVAVVGSGFKYKPANFLDSGQVVKVEAQILSCDGHSLPTGAYVANTYEGNDPADGRSLLWDTPALTWNARYAIEMTITASTGDKRTIRRPFLMDLPVSAPTNVRAAVSSGTVALTWAPNPEPDIQGYVVQWTAAADAGFADAQSADVLPPTEDEPPATRFEHQPGPGEWRYRVIAVRASTREPGVKSSAPTAASSTATVTSPTTTTAPGASSGSGSGGSSTAGTSTASTTKTTAPKAAGGAKATGGGVDLSSFSRLLDERRRSSAPTPTTEPDPGFQETLPFTPGDEPAVAAAPPNGDGQQTLAQETISDDGERRRAMAFVAGGLLAFVVAFGMRLVKSEADRIDLEPTTPEVPDSPDAPEAGVAAVAAVDDTDFDPLPLIEDLPPLEAEPMPVPVLMPAPRPASPAHAPNLDVALPPRRERRARANAVGTGNGRGTSSGISPGPAADRGTSDQAVRTRRRRTGSGDRRAPVG